MSSFVKGLNVIVVMTCLALSLGACGKKSQVTPPDGATYPRQYPKP
jgi:major membrane immunogen (membrane-anchored lipoprotein)